MESSRENGVSVIIKTQAYVDKNGKECNPLETPNARFIQLKRPRIQYIQEYGEIRILSILENFLH